MMVRQGGIEMELKKEVFGVWILFTLKGRLDAQTAPNLDKEMSTIIRGRRGHVINVCGHWFENACSCTESAQEFKRIPACS